MARFICVEELTQTSRVGIYLSPLDSLRLTRPSLSEPKLSIYDHDTAIAVAVPYVCSLSTVKSRQALAP